MVRINFFAIETDPPLQARRSNSVNKQEEKNLSSNGFCRSSEPHKENKRKVKDKQRLGCCQRAEKAVECEDDGDTNRSETP